MSAVQSSPTAANIFAVKETSFALSSVTINALRVLRIVEVKARLATLQIML
jgi:hypothetical protein